MTTADEVIQIPAFGRPFEIGTLYDQRSETWVSDLKFWNKECIEGGQTCYLLKKGIYKEKVTIICQRNLESNIKVYTENCPNNKWNNLEVGDELKLNLMSGLIDVKGASNYLRDDNVYHDQCRIRMEYSTTTSYKEITREDIYAMKQVLELEDSDKNKFWTHVVVGIQYGAELNIVFDTTANRFEENQCIPNFFEELFSRIASEGTFAMQMDNIYNEIKDKTTCRIYSDVEVDQSTCCFEECINIFKIISKTVNTPNFEGVPMKVYLLPLTIFPEYEVSLVGRLKQELIITPTKILQDLNEHINKAINAQLEPVKSQILLSKLSRYVQCMVTLKNSFQNDVLKVLLPQTKTHGNTTDLEKAIEMNNASPFCSNNLEILSDLLVKEKNILMGLHFIISSEDAQFIDNRDTLHHIQFCLLFTIHVSTCQNEILDAMEAFQKHQQSKNRSMVRYNQQNTMRKPWTDDNKLKEQITLKANGFKEFVNNNKSIKNEEVAFAIQELECLDNQPSVYIQVYQRGEMTHSKFVPPTDVEILSSEASHNSIMLQWKEPLQGKDYVDCYEVKFGEKEDVKGSEEVVEAIELKTVNTENPVTSYCLTELQPNTIYDITIQPVCLKFLKGQSTKKISVRTNPSNSPEDLRYQISDIDIVKFSWSPPSVIAEQTDVKSYEIRVYEEGNENNGIVSEETSEACEIIFKELKRGATYGVQVRACFKGGYYSSFCSSVEFQLPYENPLKIISVTKGASNYILKWELQEVKGENQPLFTVQYRHADDGKWHNLFIPNSKIEMSNLGKRRCALDIHLRRTGRYFFQIYANIGQASSRWSGKYSFGLKQDSGNETSVNSNNDLDGSDNEDDDDEDDDFFNEMDVISKEDIGRCVSKFGVIVEKEVINIKSSTERLYTIPNSKHEALLRFVERITSFDFKVRNMPLQWIGTDVLTNDCNSIRTGICHPIDLMFNIIQSLDLSQRMDLYYKLTFCKLAVPVIYKNLFFCDVSLRNVEIQWSSHGTIRDGNALRANIPVVSAVRFGKLKTSKSSFCNDLLAFQLDAATGSCGFYDYRSCESAVKRIDSEGVVEGVWYQTIGEEGRKFGRSFSLLNLRGEALEYKQLAQKLITSSDIVILFIGELNEEENKDLCVFIDEVNRNKCDLKHFIAVHSTKIANETMKSIQGAIKETLFKRLKDNNKKLITELRKQINEWMDKFGDVKSLNDRFATKNESFHESSSVKGMDAVSTKIQRFTAKMVRVKEASDSKKRTLERSSLLPLQSKVLEYSEAQRNEKRTPNHEEARQNEYRVKKIRKDQYNSIKSGLPKQISEIIYSLDEISFDGAHLRIRYYQEFLDEWCKKHLSEIRTKYIEAVKNLEEIKEKSDDPKATKHEIERLEKVCKDLNDQIITMSIGVENILREMGQIYETVKPNLNDKATKAELKRLFKRLPLLAAEMLMRGLALEIMDGDGLSVPTAWLKQVLKEASGMLKCKLSLNRDPNIFAVAVLGTQSTGKSTLLNCLFGVRFPVGAGRCTRGAFLQLIPIEIQDFPYDALLVIDTEGLAAPEFYGNVIHDNELATFVLGISDLAIINVMGELPPNIENFLEISTCAFMRMNLAQKKRKCVFVHQHCGPSCKDKNIVSRRRFLDQMDNSVKIQAKLMNQEHRFHSFKDLIQVSIERDFFYFPDLFEGSPPMSPPNWDYSYHCAKLKDYILHKMMNPKLENTLMDFSENIEQVWKAVLGENFVFSLRNSIELQVRYEMEKLQTNWRKDMASLTSKLEMDYCNTLKSQSSDEIESSYEHFQKLMKEKTDKMAAKQRGELVALISNKVDNKKVYKDWEDRTKRRIDDILYKYQGQALTSLRKLFHYLIRTEGWQKTVNDVKSTLNQKVRNRANDLLKKHDKIPKNLIDSEFYKFWTGYKNDLKEMDSTTKFKAEDVIGVFEQILRDTFHDTQKYNEVKEHFYSLTAIYDFDIKWVKDQYVCDVNEPAKKGWWIFSRLLTTSADPNAVKINDLITSVKQYMKKEYFKLEDINGVKTLKMQKKETFNCKELVTEYVKAAQNVVASKHLEKRYDSDFTLKEPFMTLVCYEVSRGEPIEAFVEAQESFLQSMKFETIMMKFKPEMKQLFEELMRKESAINICNNSIVRIILRYAFENASTEVYGRGSDESIPSVIIKQHFDRKNTVHGLVLLDILHAVKDGVAINKKMVKKYLRNPMSVLEDKIRFMINKRFTTVGDVVEILVKSKILGIRESLMSNVKDGTSDLLIDYVKHDSKVRALGIGPSDMADITEPEDETRSLKDKVEIVTKGLTDDKIKSFMKTKLTLVSYKNIMDKSIDTIRDELFSCQACCPFCNALCDRDCGKKGTDLHHAVTHRPIGIAGIRWKDLDTFSETNCQEAIKQDLIFSSGKEIEIPFKDYKTLGEPYSLWDISAAASGEDLDYWKFVSYKLNPHIIDYYLYMKPSVKIEDWEIITFDNARDVILRTYRLEDERELKCEDGIHYRDTRTY